MALITPSLPPLDVLRSAGLAEDDVTAWEAATPGDAEPGRFDADARATTAFLDLGERLVARLPERPERAEHEQTAAAAISAALSDARERFLRVHRDRVYAALTADLSKPLRVEALLERAAERFPGLTPAPATLAAERERALPDKDGAEIAQGLFLAHVLSSPWAGPHLIWAMLRPTAEALERLERFIAAGALDLGKVLVRREGRAGVVELRNPRHLNAEDDTTLAATEAAVDLVLLDPSVEVCVFRGGHVDDPRYAGRRVFGAGLNLTHLYLGQLSFRFFVDRDLGFVHKIYRGLSGPVYRPAEPEETTEKPWIAAVETYAVGGACQLLLVVDHVIAERGSRIFLPARKEGIIPGVANLRLPRLVGDRLARQAIFSGREFEAGTREADLLCDEIVEPGEMDAAIERRVELLTSSGLVSAAGNRRVMRVAQEPIDVFRAYMAVFAREQALCHFSPALVRNLEQHWQARDRRL